MILHQAPKILRCVFNDSLSKQGKAAQPSSKPDSSSSVAAVAAWILKCDAFCPSHLETRPASSCLAKNKHTNRNENEQCLCPGNWTPLQEAKWWKTASQQWPKCSWFQPLCLPSKKSDKEDKNCVLVPGESECNVVDCLQTVHHWSWFGSHHPFTFPLMVWLTLNMPQKPNLLTVGSQCEGWSDILCSSFAAVAETILFGQLDQWCSYAWSFGVVSLCSQRLSPQWSSEAAESLFLIVENDNVFASNASKLSMRQRWNAQPNSASLISVSLFWLTFQVIPNPILVNLVAALTCQVQQKQIHQKNGWIGVDTSDKFHVIQKKINWRFKSIKNVDDDKNIGQQSFFAIVCVIMGASLQFVFAEQFARQAMTPCCFEQCYSWKKCPHFGMTSFAALVMDHLHWSSSCFCCFQLTTNTILPSVWKHVILHLFSHPTFSLSLSCFIVPHKSILK